MPFDDFFWQQNYCDKCKRYFNPAHPHVCVQEDGPSKESWRKKLERWLGDYEVEQ